MIDETAVGSLEERIDRLEAMLGEIDEVDLVQRVLDAAAEGNRFRGIKGNLIALLEAIAAESSAYDRKTLRSWAASMLKEVRRVEAKRGDE